MKSGSLLFIATLTLAFSAQAAPPNGWRLTGDPPRPDQYEIGTDEATVHSGKASGYIKTKSGETEAFGAIIESFAANEFAGKRIRLSGYIKSRGVKDKSGMFMRTDGPTKLGANFDNMIGRREPQIISGDTDWKRYDIVLEVPADAFGVAIGVILRGSGQVWFDDFSLQVVDRSVPSTGMKRTFNENQEAAWQKGLEALRNKYKTGPQKPINLDFEGGSSQ